MGSEDEKNTQAQQYKKTCQDLKKAVRKMKLSIYLRR